MHTTTRRGPACRAHGGTRRGGRGFPVASILYGVRAEQIAMGILNNGRFGMAAALTGTMKYLLAGTVVCNAPMSVAPAEVVLYSPFPGTAEYAKSRKQFGKPIGEYGAIKGKIGERACLCCLSFWLTFLR
jgi:hypothetical protein